MDNLEKIRNEFKNPGAKYRSVPFWGWNDRLSEHELDEQVAEMKKQGMGGFFMHSREGLETEYLGDEWFDCIREAVKAAKREGIFAWLYDEDRFPSGGAGGLVVKEGGDDFRAKALTAELVENVKEDEKIIALYKIKMSNGFIKYCEMLSDGNSCIESNSEKILVLRREIAKPSEWFNNDSPTDNLNADCVLAFIKSTHEKYKAAFKSEFGKTIPGIFTDEPTDVDFRARFGSGCLWIPWTDSIPLFFIERRGYDIMPYLPYVFFEGEKSKKARHDFWRTITEKFIEAYSKQISEWCHNNGICYTGHYLAEPSLRISGIQNGATMPHYIYQQIPGIDLLGEQTEEYLTVKQCSSVANQYGREHIIAEIYGYTGWGFTFEGQKWIGDWLFAAGVTLRCQHMSLYSLRGCRKRDFPPSFNYNSCWWKYNHIIEDYFARISSVMCNGEACSNILVIHPMATVWSMIGGCREDIADSNYPELYEISLYEKRFQHFIKQLVDMHYDFDLGDEIILSETGKIEDGQIRVNKSQYSIIILPCLKTILKSTAALLEQFLKEGGKLISVEPSPSALEGEPSEYIDEIFNNKSIIHIDSYDNLKSSLEVIITRSISIRSGSLHESSEFFYNLKRFGKYYFLFIINNDRDKEHLADITVYQKGKIEQWDPMDGSMKEIAVNLGPDGMDFSENFAPAGSRLYIIDSNEAPKIIIGDNCLDDEKHCHLYNTFGPICKFSRTAPNVLLLDVCSYRISGGEWSDEMYVWRAQKEIRDILGMRQTHYYGLPQRYLWINESYIKDGTFVDFKLKFLVDEIPEKDVFAAIEDSYNFSIKLNGLELSHESYGWYIDKCINKVKLPGLMKGVNELILSCAYLNKMEVEDCFIIGDFGVSPSRHIIKEPKRLHFGDWCLQGYFHYSGSIIYNFLLDIDELKDVAYVLELGEYKAVIVDIKVNDSVAGYIPWHEANRVDITPNLKIGINKIDIEVMGSPINAFGPFHQTGIVNPWSDMAFLRRENVLYVEGYSVRPYGLIGIIRIYKITL